MNPLKQLYFFPVLVAILISGVLIKILIPEVFFLKTLFIVLAALTILGLGFRYITYRRIERIRDQIREVIDTLDEFDLDEPRKVNFDKSPYPIINELNEYILEIINRVRANYRANKQFTQNASHELQTPLAVIKGYVEILLQSSNIKEKEFEALGAIMQNTNRLSKLNAALILLSKIEHQRFSDFEKVNFGSLTDSMLDNFKDLLFVQEIEIRVDKIGKFEVEMSHALADILVANLIQNAIRHNEGNFIEIQITNKNYKISNIGKAEIVPPEQLFKRFKRDSDKEESLGLGLSIIRKICEVSNLEIDYTIEKKRHFFEIRNAV